jgi:FlaA1/EpsC-like NDP-sugar epimerase
MNEIDPASRFNLKTVRAYEDGDDYKGASHALNDVARTIASQYRRDTMSPVMVSGVLRLVEFALLVLSGLVVFAVYVGFGTHLNWHYPVVVACAALTAVVLLELMDGYELPSLLRPFSILRHILLVWSGTFAIMALFGFLLKMSEEFSRFWFAAWYVVGLALLVILRFGLAVLVRRWARNGKMERRAVIVGGGKTAENLIRSLEQQPYNDIRICGIFDDRDDRVRRRWSPAIPSSAISRS